MLAEGLLVILVIGMGSSLMQQDGIKPAVDIVRFKAISPQKQAEPVKETKAEESPAKETPLVEPTPPEKAEPEEVPPQPPKPRLPPPPRKTIPLAPPQMATANIAPPAPKPPVASEGRKFGPPDRVGAPRDSALVGTGPTGEPLYAAAWYREPYEDELAGYLSTASGPGWGLIACRTAPDYRVVDCVPVDEHPAGSNINRAILAAAWQFRVRPPRVGGKPRIGEWVRIRISYGLEQR